MKLEKKMEDSFFFCYLNFFVLLKGLWDTWVHYYKPEFCSFMLNVI